MKIIQGQNRLYWLRLVITFSVITFSIITFPFIAPPSILFAQENETTTESEPSADSLSKKLAELFKVDRTAGPANDDTTGPVRLTGQVTYSGDRFLSDLPSPFVTLYNISPYYSDVEPENYYWLRDAQELGKVMSDPGVSPFEYQLSLPIEPIGPAADVDNDDQREEGVQIYSINIVSNLTGDPFLDLDYGDTIGWYSSVVWGETYETEDYIVGGKLLIYAADDEQSFPAGFGPDGLLFTDDDDVGHSLPRGYTVVDMSTVPFTMDRSPTPKVDLLEQASDEQIDFSDQSYEDAFDSLIELLSQRYAFTAYYEINWASLAEAWRPKMEAAQADKDYDAYITALYELVNTFADGHIGLNYETPPSLVDEYHGSLGLLLQEVDNGKVYVTDVLPGLPAARAGIKVGSEILSINGVPIREAIDATVPFYISGHPQSVDARSGRPHAASWRLVQTLYVERGPVRSTVELRYVVGGVQDVGRNQPSEVLTTKLRRVENWDTLSQKRFYEPEIPNWSLPLEFDYLGNSDYGYLRYYTFADDGVLTLALWDRAIRNLINYKLPGLVIDLRYNEGGSLHIALLTASYFLEESFEIGKFGYYDKQLDDFRFGDYNMSVTPIPSNYYYDGELVLLIGPDCTSACEFFSYALSKSGRAKIIGYYGTPGLGGTVDAALMPDDVLFYYTVGRGVDVNGDVHIEGVGIHPDIMTPVTKETLFRTTDPLIQAAQFQLGIMLASRED